MSELGSETVELDAEYRQVREECGLLDRSGRGKLLVTGADAAEYLQGQLTNDVEALAAGEGQYAALLDRKGHMQADMRVLACPAVPFGDHGAAATGDGVAGIWIDTEAGATAVALRHLTMYSIGRDVEVADVGAEAAILSLLGPRAAEIAGTATLSENAGVAASVATVPCLAVGTRDGIDLIVPAAEAERIAAQLREAGAVPVSEAAAELLRIEAGVPRYGAEMGAETMPAEAGIVERAVSFTKGCYIGQETVARLHYKGKPNRHLRGLRLGGVAAPGAAVRLGEKEVGRLGSAAVSPALGPIGLAILRREAEPGAEVLVGEDGVTAEVTDLPFG